MMTRTLFSSVAILTSLVMLSMLAACTATPAPQPASPVPQSMPPETTTPAQAEPSTKADTPKMPETEMAAFLWTKLPDQLNNEYQKSQFISSTKKATYTGKGKWVFQASGNISFTSLQPAQNIEKSPGNWVESLTQQVTSFILSLTANYSEETDTLEIVSIEKSSGETRVETLFERPIVGQGLRVEWVTASAAGLSLRVECSVKNIGIVPLENVRMLVAIFDAKGNLMRTDNVTMSPARINVGEYGKFFISVLMTSALVPTTSPQGQQVIGKYDYRFILPPGKDLYFERPDGSKHFPQGTTPFA